MGRARHGGAWWGVRSLHSWAQAARLRPCTLAGGDTRSATPHAPLQLTEPALVAATDYFINEQCGQFKECDKYAPAKAGESHGAMGT